MLNNFVQWRGNSLVTRDKAIVLTGIFLVNNVKKKEQRLLKDLQAFLGANSNFKMTLDEVSFILGRNGVTLPLIKSCYRVTNV